MSSGAETRGRIVSGLFAMAVGVGVSALVWLQPQQLRVPAWVAHACAAAFVFAGLVILTRTGSTLSAYLSALTAAALLVPGAWVAFGPGARECSFSVPFVQGLAPGLVCRAVFGVGAILTAVVFVVLLVRAIKGHSAG
jgi:hypothetical protein